MSTTWYCAAGSTRRGWSSMDDHREISRRRFLALGGSVAAAGMLASLADPLTALGATSWPTGRLGAADALRARAGEFMPLSQFRRWHTAADRLGPANQRGLRATGSPAHEAYVDALHDDLLRARVKQLHVDSVPMQRWTDRALVAGPARRPRRRSGEDSVLHPVLRPAHRRRRERASCLPRRRRPARSGRRWSARSPSSTSRRGRTAELLHGAGVSGRTMTRTTSSPDRAVQAAVPQRRAATEGIQRPRRPARRRWSA